MIWIFAALRLADLGFCSVAWHAENPVALLRGLAVGSILWTTVLIVCVWQRRAWARYFLIAVIVLVIAAFGLVLIRLLSDDVRHDQALFEAGFISIAIYGACLFPLSKSRAILRLSTTLGGVQR